MKVLMFQPRFAPLVKSGAKLQTIRPTRKQPLKPDEIVSLRQWAGRPYRSPQIELRTAKIVGVGTVAIDDCREILVNLDKRVLRFEELHDFATRDGFSSMIEMLNWFEETHGLPFIGQLIRWE